MGASQSSEKDSKIPSEVNATVSSSVQQPLEEAKNNEGEVYPIPKGNEYDAIDKIAAELPNIIDDESRQQVEDYKEACDNGKGPMAACFATAEYISLFERRHKDAADLFRNVCYRPPSDKSPNRVLVDGTMSYPAGCYNLGKMLMTGKGGVQYNRYEAYQLLDRGCRGGHGGSCYLQAQILCARPGTLGPNIPHDPYKAMNLYENNCKELGDSISCFTLATMLLRGDKVNREADNVSPEEARGKKPLEKRENEQDRSRTKDDPYVIPRDPKRAEELLLQACDRGGHVTSCHNLVVMYMNGDDGIEPNEEKAEHYKKLTKEKINIFGGF